MSSGVYKVARQYTFETNSPAAIWTVQHKLNYIPTVDVMVDLGAGLEKVIPLNIIHLDSNTLTVNFSVPQVGVAICN